LKKTIREIRSYSDNVGDNVGDVAGMGADLFDSNVASMAAALVMATALGGPDSKNVAMVFAYAAIGLLSSVIGVATARIGKNGDPGKALNSSTYVTTPFLPYLRLCQPTSLTSNGVFGAQLP